MPSKSKTYRFRDNMPKANFTGTFKINVTAEDIKNGECGNSEKCPVAIACKRAVGLPCRVNTNVQDDSGDDCWSEESGRTRDLSRFKNRITFKLGNSNIQFKMPKGVAPWVNNFDDEKTVKPFSFELRF